MGGRESVCVCCSARFDMPHRMFSHLLYVNKITPHHTHVLHSLYTRNQGYTRLLDIVRKIMISVCIEVVCFVYIYVCVYAYRILLYGEDWHLYRSVPIGAGMYLFY